MAKKKEKDAAAIQIPCAICGEKIFPHLYTAHIQDKHVPPPAASAAPAPQPQPPAQPTYSGPPQAIIPQGNAPITPPPPPMPRNPFITAIVLYNNGGRINAKITGARSSAGVRSKNRPDIPDRGGWILDLQCEKEIEGAITDANGTLQSVRTNQFSARVNVGDSRHQKLWARFQQNWIGQTITVRLPTPMDGTKAQWVID